MHLDDDDMMNMDDLMDAQKSREKIRKSVLFKTLKSQHDKQKDGP